MSTKIKNTSQSHASSNNKEDNASQHYSWLNYEKDNTSKTKPAALNYEEDFPLSEKKPEILFTPTGKAMEEITMENLLAGKITEEDCRISERTLEYQAQISESAGNPQMALNFRRAAELTRFSDEEVLAIYEAIRPYRSTKEELEQIVDDLEKKGAHINSHFIKEAIAVYEKRKKLKGDK